MPRFPLLISLLLLCLGSAKAQFQTVFLIGSDNAAITEFEQENPILQDYYWSSGDFTSLGGLNWTSGQETWNSGNATDTFGFPRSLATSHAQTDIYFSLTSLQAGPNQPLRFTFDLFGLKPNTTSDLEASLNGNPVFWSESGIASAKIVTITPKAGAAGARTGPNKLTLRRTGGQIDAGSAWILFDFLRMEADSSPQYISSFTSSNWLVRPGESCTLNWSLIEPTAALSLNQGIGDVTGRNSITITPATSASYILSATLNGRTQTRTVNVFVTPWLEIFEVGADDTSNADFSHEDAADDDFFLAGNFSSIGGPVSTSPESLNDDIDTTTPAGRTGDPRIGFERAVTEFDPAINLRFIGQPQWSDPTARIRITADILNLSSASGTGTHQLEFSLNGKVVRSENTVTTIRLIQFEITGIAAALATGPNVLTIRRAGGTLAGSVGFDYVMMDWLPGTPPAISSITDDPILGTRTISWTAQTGRSYTIQKSSDGGASWSTLAIGFPSGGAPSASLSWEDRATPLSQPRPDYRALLE